MTDYKKGEISKKKDYTLANPTSWNTNNFRINDTRIIFLINKKIPIF